MNKIIYKIFPILTLAFALSMTACLTDSEYDNNQIGINPTNNKNYVEVHLTSGDNSNSQSLAFDLVNRDTTITKFIPINLTSGAATSDVTVTFELLNTQNSTNVDTLVNKHGLVVPDPTKFTVVNPSMKVTIPKGSSTGYVQVKFNPSDFLGNIYIFGINITAVSDPKYVISNLSTGFIKFGIKNQYDKMYHCVGVFTHPTAGPRPIDTDKRLVTINGTTNQITVGDLGSSYTVNITVDPLTNDVTYSAGNPVTILPLAARSYYDPSTGIFYLHYYYVGGSGNRLIDETYTPL